ncbi:hypothetical protein [Paraburkholderia phenoliruptrix]|uniref:hypothetical protein n=1 Tax=Paraburkholderia phenoliruptrix TaxID=252970 RepID=UPI001C6EBA39|nr:hypothetical protein [Paraburkholderia phenoliruptrix]MBW9102905.1 hypothetical protein [Paraburkholderia phenoliruptrix]MBW9132879.1 hypothetical protein [Paraburkholderia ginsengiterrae]
MNKQLIELARAAGLTVVLNGRIGREEYHSVSGPISALERFAEAYRAAAELRVDETKQD